MKKVVIVGAGPAGLVAAAYLARKGFTVDIFEKRSAASLDPNKEVNHSFTIVLNYKGIRSIQGSGLSSLADYFDFPLLACVRHLGNTHHAFLRPAHGSAMNFERSELNAWLLSSVQKLHPSVKVHYDATCTDIHFTNKEATFTSDTGATITAK
jgi:kynurenine 3-monooxygenase